MVNSFLFFSLFFPRLIIYANFRGTVPVLLIPTSPPPASSFITALTPEVYRRNRQIVDRLFITALTPFITALMPFITALTPFNTALTPEVYRRNHQIVVRLFSEGDTTLLLSHFSGVQ